MVIYKNLSLLGIFNHHYIKYQYGFMVIHRIMLVIFGMGILKES
jgi:hypothetical protein